MFLLQNLGQELKGILKLLSEHGIARVLIAVSIAMAVYFSFNVPNEPWQVNAMIYGVAAVLGVTGALVRWGEMHSKMFAGRAIVFSCANCGEILKPPLGTGREPPIWIQCGNNACGVANILQ